ncbi:hypothetical protein GCM10022403_087280 [Streptomyces coacervatus]|uniref:AAA family ATPase n=1 Tax=Streptomyces coacervatus TaxID=647381 RepID=A0ABP7JCW7_9ACTN|nr:AAA family ATPase [Streptomyces coacervatus]MDF2273391.1 AAA family ATPase [Streptomyces coacervatus]
MTTDPWADQRFDLDRKAMAGSPKGVINTPLPYTEAELNDPEPEEFTPMQKARLMAELKNDLEFTRYAAQQEARERHRRLALEERERRLKEGGDAEAFAVEIMTTEQLRFIPKPDALVTGWLFLNTLVRLYGPPKSLKSFVMLDIAGSVANGMSWAGMRCRKAKVLYVIAEGVDFFSERALAWEADKGRPMGVLFYPKAVQISDPDQMANLVAYARCEGIEFIIFDTQARCTVGVNENDNTDMGVVVSALDVLRVTTGACVALVHHSGHETGKARGATAVLGAVDAEFEVRRYSNEGTLKVITKAQKNVAEIDDLWFAPRSQTFTDADGTSGTSIVLDAAQRPQGGDSEPEDGDVSTTPDQKVIDGVMAFVEANPGATTGDIHSQVTGRRDKILFTLRWLIRNGRMNAVKNGRNVNHYVVPDHGN